MQALYFAVLHYLKEHIILPENGAMILSRKCVLSVSFLLYDVCGETLTAKQVLQMFQVPIGLAKLCKTWVRFKDKNEAKSMI